MAALAAIFGFALALIALSIAGNLALGFRPDTSASRPVRADAPQQRFAVLRNRHSNQCGLQAASLATLPSSGRLQGACCSPMNLAHYKQQLGGLKNYRAVPLVPTDPYDVSVRLAARLIAYDRSIQLGEPEQRVYDQAARLSQDHGPCCCHCWRWSAFAGQAKKFILERRFSAAEIAAIWGLENGCGGQA
jgi:hypothetical protein